MNGFPQTDDIIETKKHVAHKLFNPKIRYYHHYIISRSSYNIMVAYYYDPGLPDNYTIYTIATYYLLAQIPHFSSVSHLG